MKNTYSKITGILIAGVFAMFGLAQMTSAASVSWNTMSNDCPTVSIGNWSTGEGSSAECWPTSLAPIQDTQIVNVIVYYHNTGTDTASDARVKITPSTTTGTTHTFTGTVWSGGSAKSGTVSFTSTTPVTLQYISTKFYPDQTENGGNPAFGQSPTGNEIFSSSGLRIGDIAGDPQGTFAHQGTVKAAFKVVSVSQGNTGATPSVITGGATVNSNSAAISGTLTSNGANASTFFRYGLGNTNSSTADVIRGNVNTSFSEQLSGLSNGYYSYQACAQNIDVIPATPVCGIVKHFTINGGGQNNDAVAPVIYTMSADPSSTSATLHGKVSTVGIPASVTYIFKYGTSSSNLNMVSGNGSTSLNDYQFSRSISGLTPNTTYFYQACGSNGLDACGSILSFTTDSNYQNPCDVWPYCNNNNGYNQNPIIDTLGIGTTNSNAATLQGRVQNTGYPTNVTYYFKYGTSYGYLGQTTGYGYTSSNGYSFSQYISGLNTNTTYYYQACGYNSTGTNCGSILSFTTGYTNDNCNYGNCNNPPYNPPIVYAQPSVSTLGAIQKGGTYSVLDGYYNANGCSVSTWFEYGPSQALGYTTTSFARGNASGSMAQFISNLNNNTTYYYRAVAQNCNGTARGVILSFTTNNDTVVPPPTVITKYVNTVTGGGGGSNLVRLTITNNQDTVARSEEITYEVTWENISGKVLKDLVLEIALQKELAIDRTRDGKIDDSANSVIININELDIKEKDDTSIDTTVRGGLQDGDPVVARAILAFENPTTQSQENSIAYDSDEYRGSSGLGASLFGLSFLPNSLIGWLIILILIVIIVLLARHYMKQGATTTVAMTTPVIPPQSQPTAPTNPYNDYPPYRPTPNM